MPRPVATLCLAALLAALAGCEARPVGISGTVTRAGEKLTWPDGGYMLVVFSPETVTPTTRVYSAETDIATSGYKIAAIAPGRYKVAVQQFSTKSMDALGGVYDPGNTTLVYDVTHDGQVIDIDLPKELPRPAAKGGGAGGKGGKGGFGKGKKDESKKDEDRKPDDKKPDDQ